MTKVTPQHPFGLAIHGNYLFYTDWIQHSVTRVNKFTGEDLTRLRTNIPRPMSVIAIANQSLICEESPCSRLNGGCEDVCSVEKNGQEIVQCSCFEGR